MVHRTFRLAAGALIVGGAALAAHAQMAQDPLLSRTAAVEPNIVFVFDDSGSMPATAIYQHGGIPGGYGMTGPGPFCCDSRGRNFDDNWMGTNRFIPAPTTFYGQSPDVNRIYYDPRTRYARRINADSTPMAAGSTSSISSFKVYFYRPATIGDSYNVNSVSVVNRGANYPASGITATFPPPPAGGVQATANILTATSPNVASVRVTNMGRGYPAPPTVVTATFSAPAAGGTTATGTVQIGSSSTITGATMTNMGKDYTSAPVVTFSAPTPSVPGGVTATGTATLDTNGRKVSDATLVTMGSGYTSTPTVVFSAPPAGGTLPAATAVLSLTRRVTSITVASGGCYDTRTGPLRTVADLTGGLPITNAVEPTLTVNFGPTVASCNSTNRRPIASITVTGGDGGYTGIPVLGVTGASTPGVFTVNMSAASNVVSDVNITNSGSGYVSGSPPTISFTGGGGSGAAYNPVMVASGRITGISLTNPGVGYAGAPTITLSGGGGSGASASAVVTTTYSVTRIDVTDGGSGYTSLPTITLSNNGTSPATLVPTLGNTNVISSVQVTNAGAGYLTTPTLVLSPLVGAGSGSGATFSYTYNTVPTYPDNKVWDGTGTPTTLNDYFNPSYTPDSSSPLVAGATAIPYPNTADSNTTAYPKFKSRTDCAGATSCSWSEELQNYANWKTYHSTRMELAKTGIGLAFQPLNPTFRLGWGTINTLASNARRLEKGVRLYDPTVQSEFLTWLYAIDDNGGTPNRIAIDRVGQYFQRSDNDGPWANTPTGSNGVTSSGAEDTTHASCRRSYSMLMTDGYYNDSYTSMPDQDTSDGPLITNPTSYQYKPAGPYSDTISGTSRANTFADVAMKYWVNDLRPNLPNNLRTVTGDEAYWQHMNFYAIGLGVTGTLDSSDPAILASLTGNASTTPPRTRSWPVPSTQSRESIDDMWHATVNGRGKMLNAKTTDELNESIQKMMSDIGGKEGTQSGVAVSTASLTKDTKKYTPSYTPISWNGNVTAYNLDPTSGNQTGIAWQVETLTATDVVTGAKSYSSLIPAASTRNIYVGNGAATGATRAVPFLFPDMVTAGLTTAMTGTVNAGLINYLRGDPVNEDTSAGAASPTAIYRARVTRLADIVNSTPVFVKDSVDLSYDLAAGPAGRATYREFVTEKKGRAEGVLFVGANDGMLHAFRDGTYDPVTGTVVNQGGVETFAYVPHALLPTLSQLADKTYVHRFYVDGPNIETDAYFGSGASTTGWRNLVIGSTGAGAGAASSATASPRTGVFAIDVTSLNSNPTSLSATNVLWEVGSANADFAELGYLLTDVQAGPTKDGSWVAIFGNGYESKSCQARLFVVDLKNGAKLAELNTNAGSCGTGTRNGLGGVRIVRDTGGIILGVYAGDLLGNVWKFSLNDSDRTKWKVDYRLFTAGATQPITAAPAVLTLPVAGSPVPPPITGYMVVVGTGKFFEVSDITNNAQQSLYGIWDPVVTFGITTVPAGTALSNKSLLVQQTIGAATLAPNGNTYFPISTHAVDYDLGGKRGWFIDLPNTGQRLVYPLDFLSGRFAAADTISPSNVSLDPCSNLSGGTGYFYIIDALSGAGPTEAVLDTNGDGNVDTSDLVVSGLEGKADGRNVTLEVSRNLSRTTYVNVSGGAPGGTLITISCRLTGTCTPDPGTGGPGSGPTFRIQSREWRQLFMR